MVQQICLIQSLSGMHFQKMETGVQLYVLAVELYRAPPLSDSCSATLSRLID